LARERFYGKFSANFNARTTSAHLPGDKAVTRSSKQDLPTVRMVSQLITHSFGIPSSLLSLTSTGMLRIVRVIMATVTAERTAYA
jgi:hypothetical protein